MGPSWHHKNQSGEPRGPVIPDRCEDLVKMLLKNGLLSKTQVKIFKSLRKNANS